MCTSRGKVFYFDLFTWPTLRGGERLKLCSWCFFKINTHIRTVSKVVADPLNFDRVRVLVYVIYIELGKHVITKETNNIYHEQNPPQPPPPAKTQSTPPGNQSTIGLPFMYQHMCVSP